MHKHRRLSKLLIHTVEKEGSWKSKITVVVTSARIEPTTFSRLFVLAAINHHDRKSIGKSGKRNQPILGHWKENLL